MKSPCCCRRSSAAATKAAQRWIIFCRGMKCFAPRKFSGHHTTRELRYNWLKALMTHEVTLLLQEIKRGGNESRAALDNLLPGYEVLCPSQIFRPSHYARVAIQLAQ